MKRLIRLAAYFTAVASAVVCVTVFRPVKFETSLASLVGDSSIMPPPEIGKAVSSRVQAISSAKSFDDALNLAEKFVAALDTNTIRSLAFRFDGGSLGEIVDFYRCAGGGFLSSDDRRSAANSTLIDEVVRSLSSAAPSLFAFQTDPCRFLDRFVKSLPREFGAWRIKNDVLAAEMGDRHHVLISFSLPGDAAFDIDLLPKVLSPVVESVRRLNAGSSDARISISGVPVHTLESSCDCKREITLLSVFSIAFVVLLAVRALRRPLGVVMVIVNLAVSSAAGFAALALFSDMVHLISIVFGTTLIGLVVDYSFHSFLADEKNAVKVRSNLAKSLLTTLASLVPLAFSGLSVLTETALFLAVGLLAAFAVNRELIALSALKNVGGWRRPSFMNLMERSRSLDIALALLAAAALVGVFKADFRTEAGDLYSPSPELKAAESLFSSVSGIGDSAAMAVVEGDSLDEILAEEERHFAGSVCLSRFVPSAARRESDFKIIESFYKKDGAALAETLGISGQLPPSPAPAKIELSDIPAKIAERFLVVGADSRLMSIVPSVDADAAAGAAGVKVYAPRRMLIEILNRYESRTMALLMLSLAILFAVMAVFYRWRAFKMMTPAVVAVGAAMAAVAFTGDNVNFFHLLAVFMIMGMSIDYTIFLAEEFRGGEPSVVCSFLTSLAGFGALSFVSFPIVRSFGTAFAVGLPVSFFAAWVIFRPRAKTDERIATPVGMEAAYLLYRLFGKRVFDFIALAVADIVWFFDPVSRKAAGTRKRIENFARSLVDKITVLSLGKGQPKVVFDESGDAADFIGDISAKRGAVVISSHLGCIETLAAYGECPVKFHVFMSLSQTSVFRAFRDRHFRRSMIEVHATEGFGMAELFLASAIVEKGDVVLMAGDRGGGRVRTVAFAGAEHRFPEGAFRMARHLERNVYFAASVLEDGGYRVFVKRLPVEDMFGAYVRVLEDLVKKYPDQWYQWEGESAENG